MTIAIIDYGCGNLTSLSAAISRLGFEPVIATRSNEINAADKIVLPGVGAFGEGMLNLRGRGLVEVLDREVNKHGKLLLGVCLGFQLLARDSEEFGHFEGLGWVDAHVSRLSPSSESLRVPHVGWDELLQVNDSPLFKGVPEDALFYYTHNYVVHTEDPAITIGECDYGGKFVSAVQSRNIFGTQFHPEKSQRHGLAVLENFLRL